MEKSNPKLRVIGRRPDASRVPAHWAIYNAARPLVGNTTWEGEWFNGPHYAAVDPADIDEAWMSKTNLEDNLATELEFVDEETAINEQIDYYEGLMPEVAAKAKCHFTQSLPIVELKFGTLTLGFRAVFGRKR